MKMRKNEDLDVLFIARRAENIRGHQFRSLDCVRFENHAGMKQCIMTLFEKLDCILRMYSLRSVKGALNFRN